MPNVEQRPGLATVTSLSGIALACIWPTTPSSCRRPATGTGTLNTTPNANAASISLKTSSILWSCVSICVFEPPGLGHCLHGTPRCRPSGANIGRQKSLVAGSVAASSPDRRRLCPGSLTAAADQYIVSRGDQKTVIAGYHWFSDWGRDTMIALPGLTLADRQA